MHFTLSANMSQQRVISSEKIKALRNSFVFSNRLPAFDFREQIMPLPGHKICNDDFPSNPRMPTHSFPLSLMKNSSVVKECILMFDSLDKLAHIKYCK